MQITVEVDEKQITRLVSQRIGELFSDDARYRDTSVRDAIRGIVDVAAQAAVEAARDAIKADLPAIATDAVHRAVRADIDKAAARGLAALKKLYVGFDPNQLTAEQRAWLERQIVSTADKR